MVEREGNGIKPKEFIEFFFTPDGLRMINASNLKESLKRRQNRERIEGKLMRRRQQTTTR